MDRQIYDSVRQSGIVQGRHKHSTAVKYKRDRARGISCDCPGTVSIVKLLNQVIMLMADGKL